MLNQPGTQSPDTPEKAFAPDLPGGTACPENPAANLPKS